MLEVEASRVVIERVGAGREDDDRWWVDRGGGRCDSFAEAVADHPDLAAWMLEQCGVSYDDFQMALWAEEMDEDGGYRPLMASWCLTCGPCRRRANRSPYRRAPPEFRHFAGIDRKSVVEGKRGSVRLDLGGRRTNKKKKK